MHEHPDTFAHRHLGPNEADLAQMLETVGVSSIDELIFQTLPDNIALREPLPDEAPMSEYAYMQHIRAVADKNELFTSCIGQGYYGTLTPAAIQRNIFENPGWYTQYTPYQAEISQGRLEALLNFQTMIADFTGLPIANASLLDEATGAAEAMTMLRNQKLKKVRDGSAKVILVADTCFPQTIEVIRTRASVQDIEVRVGDWREWEIGDEVFAALVQFPNAQGEVEDYQKLSDSLKEKNSYLIVVADLMSLALLEAPGNWGADVVVGSAQRFGVPMGFGGPHAGYFSTSEAFTRMIPGRIIGVSIDSENKPAYRMALQTREQHIRRDKATSNICTAQALLAIMAGMYAVYHGPGRIRGIAQRIHDMASLLADGLQAMALPVKNEHFFDTLTLAMGDAAAVEKIRQEALSVRYNFCYLPGDEISISLDETTGPSEVQAILEIFAKALSKDNRLNPAETEARNRLPEGLMRESEYLTHPVFNTHHSETAMMRYIKSLENKDLSLTMSMIPLGSCTMKLNAATELMPVSWPEFASLHPFVPQDQATGYHEMIDDLGKILCGLTGFHGVSFQPNSGAQGEFTGLMTIRAYHHSRGDEHRRIALIPSSAHGTNPASAVMAGMKVVVVKCDDSGNVEVDDLRAKAEEHSEQLSCLMITYPSTHGVFEKPIVEICEIIHKHGGQVYMDGANFNAQVGLTNPGSIGADVCHLNLHKTFAIPHGGGGPGMGPICVAEHLTPFLPGHPLVKTGGAQGISAVSAAPFGSASILVISYAYCKMLGTSGLSEATRYAILNANYMKSRLEEHYPVLYKGNAGRVAHEFILDMRGFKHSPGLEVDDITKRLIDYGFHAPTVSFPVPGTLMIEPTESEPLEELDRFCDAMIAIRKEIGKVESGEYDAEDNVLKNAPHTQSMIVAEDWSHPYTRAEAAFPVHALYKNKFWAVVGRINNTYGDRNVVCVCPPIESYMD